MKTIISKNGINTVERLCFNKCGIDDHQYTLNLF